MVAQETVVPDQSKPARRSWIAWATSSAVLFILSAFLFRHAGDWSGAWLWSIRLVIAAVACGLVARYPAIISVFVPVRRWLSVESHPVLRGKVYPAFDWLRLFLAVEVVIHHFLNLRWVPVQEVPAFLCVSGFLVLQSLQHDRRAFWMSRGLRILPALVAAIAFDGIVFGPTAAIKDLTLATSLQGSIRGAVDYPLWSIGVEVVAYAIMYVLWRWTRFYHRPRLILATVAAVWLLSPYVPIPQARLLTIAFLGSYLLLHGSTAAPRWLLPASIGCMLLSVFVPSTTDLTLPAALYGSAWALVDLATRIRLPRLNWDLSYGIYIWHIPVLAALSHHSTPVRFAGVLMVAVLSWLLIERPALALKRRLKLRVNGTGERSLDDIGLQGLRDIPSSKVG